MELTTTQTAIQKLENSLTKNSLGSLVRSKRRSMLLVDISGSMNSGVRLKDGRVTTKIEALRETVTTLTQGHPVPVASFRGGNYARPVIQMVEGPVPHAGGGTPLAEAINFGQTQGASHLVVVTDGQPDNQATALHAARAFGGPIDVFYIGEGNDDGALFAEQLARSTGGSVNVTDIGAPKELSAGIAGLLGEGI